MSVYKSKRGTSAMQFIETARQLEAHTFACCIKAPKRYSFFLTSRIMELASEVHDHVRAANNIWPTNQHEAQLRRDELLRANIALQNLNPKLQPRYGTTDIYHAGEYMLYTDGLTYRCTQDTAYGPEDYAQAWEVQDG